MLFDHCVVHCMSKLNPQTDLKVTLRIWIDPQWKKGEKGSMKGDERAHFSVVGRGGYVTKYSRAKNLKGGGMKD